MTKMGTLLNLAILAKFCRSWLAGMEWVFCLERRLLLLDKLKILVGLALWISIMCLKLLSLLTFSAHAREGYSSRPVCLSVML